MDLAISKTYLDEAFKHLQLKNNVSSGGNCLFASKNTFLNL